MLQAPRVSPDGRYLAYQSDESGRFEVYVTDYPPRPGRRWRVSPGGGTSPRWRRDGQELFFLDGSGVMAAPVGSNPAAAAALASRVWLLPASRGEQIVDYDIVPDGSRLLAVLEKQSPPTSPQLVVVRNWIEEIRRRVSP
jgi:Tol biopolymer transport system component